MVRRFLLILNLLVSVHILADDQHWLDTSLTWKRSDRRAILFTTQNKYRSWNQSDGLTSKNWVIGYQWKLTHGFSLALNYKQELKRYPDHLDVVERRPFLDIGWQRLLTNRASFDFRLRTEANQYIQDMTRDRYTFRFRLRITGRMQLGKWHITPYLALEPYYDTAHDTFHKYRIYTGATFPVNPNLKLKLGYVRQQARGQTANHVLNAGISLRF